MASRKLTELALASNLALTDIAYIVQDPDGNPVSVKMTIQQLLDLLEESGDIASNTTHREGDGSDHSFIDQDVTAGASPSFDGANITGISAGIDYSNPIVANSTSTITPNNGDYFTSTSKLVTLTGTAGEVFEPAGSGETSRIIWGRGAGAAAILTIDTSSLGIGDVFAIEADNGESRILMLNPIGDLVKVGGVVIVLRCSMWGDNPSITLLDNVDTTIPLTDVTLDNSGQMADTNNEIIKIIRPGQYNGQAHLFFQDPVSTPTFDHETQVRVISSISPSPLAGIGLLLAGQATGAGNTNSALRSFKIYVAGETLELRGKQTTSGGTESLVVLGGQSNPSHQFVSIEEIDPW